MGVFIFLRFGFVEIILVLIYCLKKNIDKLLEEWYSLEQEYHQNEVDEYVFGRFIGSKPFEDLIQKMKEVLYEIESRYRRGERPVKNEALLFECMKDDWDEE